MIRWKRELVALVDVDDVSLQAQAHAQDGRAAD
jgi:hypothetical protein